MPSTTPSLLLRGVGALVTCDPDVPGPLGLIHDAAVLCRGDRIVYAGPESGLPRRGREEPITLELDGHLVTPGLVDCHTHLVFAGDRLDDFEGRLRGESYGEIAARGGGILSTVAATRAASDEMLIDLADRRVEHAAAHGITTIEVKSGYGLSTEHELRILRTIGEADKRNIVDLIPTFLGAHSLPLEARGSEAARRRYVDQVVDEMLPQVAEEQLARFCDVFVERGAFTVDEGRRILRAAADLGLGLKLHADQLTSCGGAELAGELGAVSADHLEQASAAGLAAMAEAGTIAVLLPGAAFFLRDRYADARRFVDAGVEVAVATDLNPGTSPTQNLLLMAQMAVLGSGLTIPEAIRSVTEVAARAIGLHDRGVIRAGKRADLALWRRRDPRELIYRLGSSPCSGVIKDGRYHRVESPRAGRVLVRT
jgi:imidazolonepropionase